MSVFWSLVVAVVVFMVVFGVFAWFSALAGPMGDRLAVAWLAGSVALFWCLNRPRGRRL